MFKLTALLAGWASLIFLAYTCSDTSQDFWAYIVGGCVATLIILALDGGEEEKGKT